MSYDCGGCGYSSGSSAGYSALESIANSYNSSSGYSSSGGYGAGNVNYMIAEPVLEKPKLDFSIGTSASSYDKKQENMYESQKPVSTTYSHVTDGFLALDRPRTVFIGNASEIKEFVEEAFTATTGMEMPDDIIVHVLDKKDFEKANQIVSRKVNSGVMGFAINRKRLGQVSEIFVRQGELDKIMLTLGHELGHVLTRQLSNQRNEEAKAFAFSIAWMKKIKELNIANLSTAIRLEQPAKNGLHDVALDFVLDRIAKGEEGFDIYKDLIRGFIGVEENA